MENSNVNKLIEHVTNEHKHFHPSGIPEPSSRFQYITCYGSIALLELLEPNNQEFQYITCYGSIYWLYSWQDRRSQFQYITCYGSIRKAIEEFPEVLNFNTSHVTVQSVNSQHRE